MSHGLVTDERMTRESIDECRHLPVHVVGAASAEGVAVLRLLLRRGFDRLVVHDQRPCDELRRAFRTTHGAYSRQEQDDIWQELRPVLDAGRYDGQYLHGMADAALVVLGQGWYLDADNRQRVVEAVPPNARVTSMVELYFALHPGPIAGVTGTNGKSTTVALAEQLLVAGGVPHRTAGNERSTRQFLPDIADVAPGTWALLELSNRQFLQLTRSPQVAAITSLTPDHLEEHDGFDGYREAKARIFAFQHEHDIAIANADDPEALCLACGSAASPARLVRCGTTAHPAPSVTWRGDELVAEDVPRCDGEPLAGRVVLATRGDLRLPGDHNLRNAAVAAALAVCCGTPTEAIAPALRAFEGKALRLQHLDDVGSVQVWSDLKSTTPEATVAALTALSDRRVVLIAGGEDKGLDYAPLARAVVATGSHVLAVPGSATDKLEQALQASSAEKACFERVADLEAALERAFDVAASGDAVIVSPAAAGFWTRQLQGGASLRTLVRRRASALEEVPDR